MATFDPLHVPPTALEHGGVEVLRAAIVEGGLHVSLRRAFDDGSAQYLHPAVLQRRRRNVQRIEGCHRSFFSARDPRRLPQR